MTEVNITIKPLKERFIMSTKKERQELATRDAEAKMQEEERIKWQQAQQERKTIEASFPEPVKTFRDLLTDEFDQLAIEHGAIVKENGSKWGELDSIEVEFETGGKYTITKGQGGFLITLSPDMSYEEMVKMHQQIKAMGSTHLKITGKSSEFSDRYVAAAKEAGIIVEDKRLKAPEPSINGTSAKDDDEDELNKRPPSRP